MIGLEYILGLYNLQHIELAERLGIKKQNVNLWIKGKQNIPKKYLPILEALFNVDAGYFPKEVDEIEKLEIQKEKLKKDLQPIIESHERVLSEGAAHFDEIPVYDQAELNTLESNIAKARMIQRFKATLEAADRQPFLDAYRIIIELLEQAGTEIILHKTMQGLAHYLNVLPGEISSGDEQAEFEAALFEVLDDHNY